MDDLEDEGDMCIKHLKPYLNEDIEDDAPRAMNNEGEWILEAFMPEIERGLDDSLPKKEEDKLYEKDPFTRDFED